MIKNDWDKKLRRAATGSKEQVSQLGQDLIDMNYDDWTEGESYESLVKRYQGKGQKAMDDTIGQVAARTGGLASSYAAQAGQQAYGGWMENLENAARSLYDTERQELIDRYNIANDMYQRDYQRGRDAIADQRYATEWDYKMSQDAQATTDKRREDMEERILNAAYYGLANWDDMFEDAKMAGMTKADFDRLVAQAQAAKQESVTSEAPKFYAVSPEADSTYVEEMQNIVEAEGLTEEQKEIKAVRLMERILSATGNSEYAYALLYSFFPDYDPEE
jgi:hypothetical protein